MKKIKISKEMAFFTYLLESYAAFKKQPTNIIFQQLKELNLIDKIFNNYEMYHSESINNAFKDIDYLLKSFK